MAFDSSGNLFAADVRSGNINEFTPAGVRSTFASGLGGPCGLAFDSHGNLFEADGNSGNIYEFAPSGAKSTFASGLSFPIALAFDSHGNLFEVNENPSHQGQGSIDKFTPSGAESFVCGSLYNPCGLTIDSHDNLFVADTAANSIYEITSSGNMSLFATMPSPWGLAFDSHGNLFAGNGGSGSIDEFAPDGTMSIFASGLLVPTGLAFSPVPEPSAIAGLISAGAAAGLGGWSWRRKRRMARRAPIRGRGVLKPEAVASFSLFGRGVGDGLARGKKPTSTNLPDRPLAPCIAAR